MTQGTRRTAWGIVAAAVVVAAAAWALLGDGEGGEFEGSVTTPTVVSAPEQHVTTFVETDGATPLAIGADDVASTTPVIERSNHSPLPVSGRALDSDGEPIAGARFLLASTLDGTTFEGVTSQDGRVAFEVPAAHAVRMAQGTAPETLTVTSPLHAAFFTTLESGAVEHLSLGDVTLAPALKVTGRVVTVNGRPIVGATVLSSFPFDESDDSYHLAAPARKRIRPDVSMSTDDSGRFTLPAPTKTGDWAKPEAEIVVEAEGYARKRLDIAIEEDHGTVEIADIVIDEGRTIRGVVSTRENEVVAGALVFVGWPISKQDFEYASLAEHAVGGERIRDAVWWTRTDENGAYRCDHISRGRFNVHVFSAIGQARRRQSPGDDVVDITLTTFIPVTYQCVDESTGTPLAPTRLAAFIAWAPESPFTTRAADFRLDTRAQDDDAARWTITQHPKKVPFVRVDLDGYLSTPRVEDNMIFLRRRAELDVHVTNEHGVPIENARVMLCFTDVIHDLHELAQAFSDVDGHASFTATGPGSRSIVVYTPGFTPFIEDLELLPGRTMRNVQLAPSSRLVVHVRDVDGNPVPAGGAVPAEAPWISSRPEPPPFAEQERWRQMYTEPFRSFPGWSDGPIWTGPGTFIFCNLRGGAYELEYEPGGFASAEVVPGETTEVEVTLRRWPVVSGVVMSNGRPVEGAIVTTESAADRAFNSSGIMASYGPAPPRLTPRSATTDSDGRWSMPVQSGEQYVIVDLHGAAATESLHTFAFDERYEVIHEVDTHVLHGFVVDTDGTPVAGARVAARPRGGTTTSDDDGRFTFRWASVNAETVTAQHADYIAMPKPARASAGNAIELVLRRGATITCHFEDATGTRIDPDKPRHRRVRFERLAMAEADVPPELAESKSWFMKTAVLRLAKAKDGTSRVARGLRPARYRVSVDQKTGHDDEVIASREIEVSDASSIEITLTVPITR